MDQSHSAVCICETPGQLQRAIDDLQRIGIDKRTLSTATKDDSLNTLDLDSFHAGDETFNIPGIGALLVNGPLASWIATAFDNEAGAQGVSIIGAALTTLGIPHDSILQYEAALRADRQLLILQGLPDTVFAAVKVIGGTTHSCHTVHGEMVFNTINRASLLGAATYLYQS